MAGNNNSHRVLLLSSRNSVFGAQVLRAVRAAGLNLVGVVVEDAYPRGDLCRFRRYARKYGLGATLFRAAEATFDQLTTRRWFRETVERVEEAAVETGTPIEQVASINSPAACAIIGNFNAGLGLLGGVSILRRLIVRQFPLGMLNVHSGILPRYRGNYCNRWALLNGDPCGVSVYLLDEGLDTGPVLATGEVARMRGERLEHYEARVSAAGAKFLAGIASKYLAGGIEARAQDPSVGHQYGLLPLTNAIRLHFLLWQHDRAKAPAVAESGSPGARNANR